MGSPVPKFYGIKPPKSGDAPDRWGQLTPNRKLSPIFGEIQVVYDKSVTSRAVAAVRLLTRIRQENPALWSRIESFARGEDEAGSDSGIGRQAGQGSTGPERSRETDAGETHAA